MQNVLLGITGSVAAYKAAYLIRALQTRQLAVQTIATPAALQFVGAATFRALSGKAVACDEWQSPLSPDGMDHIALARAANCLVVAPASADFIAKAAHGAADNLLLAAFLAANCPRFVAPAMNQQMWRASATQRNLQTLAQDGVRILPPDCGEQACGETGPGRMMDVDKIAAQLADFLLSQQLLRGRRVVVNTGATVEYIDDMRVISNMSSGKMGFCIAAAAAQCGATVQIVAANTTAPPPLLPLRRAVSNADMHTALVEECQNADVFIAAAAIADYRPQQTQGKIPRQKGMTLKLTASADILADIARRYPQMFVVGFDAQTGDAADVAAARRKLRRKNADLIVANSLHDAGGEQCQLTLVSGGDVLSMPRQSKQQAAEQLVAEIAARIVSRETLQEIQSS